MWQILDGLCGTQPLYCPSWLWYDTPRERGENTSKPGRQPWVPASLYAKRGTLPSTPRSLVCLRRPRTSLSLMRPSWSYGDSGKSEACLLTLHLLELDIQVVASREAAISRGATEVLDARQGKIEDSLSQSSSRERRVMRRKSLQILHFEVP